MNIKKCALCCLDRVKGFEPFCLAHGACEDCQNNPRTIGKKCDGCMRTFLAASANEKSEDKKKSRKTRASIPERDLPKSLHNFVPSEQDVNVCLTCSQPQNKHGWYKLFAPQTCGLGPIRNTKPSMSVWVIARKASEKDAILLAKDIKISLNEKENNQILLVKDHDRHIVSIPISQNEKSLLIDNALQAGTWLFRLKELLSGWKFRERVNASEKPEIKDLSENSLAMDNFDPKIQMVWARTT